MRSFAGCALALLALGAFPVMAARPALGAPAHAATRATHCIFDHRTLRTPATICRPRAKHYPARVHGAAERAIYDSILLFGIPYSVLLQIAECESGLNPVASNGSHFGLFQFAPATFQRGALDMFQETGVVARSYWNPLDAAYVAGYLFATGQSPAWSCEPPR